jgi:hypothetical protein
VQEDLDQNSGNPTTTHNITLTCSSILSVLENRTSGRRTNRSSYNYRYLDRQITLSPTEGVWGNFVLSSNVDDDKSMNRIETLHNAQFDFGKDAGGDAVSGPGGGGGGSADSSKNPPADNYNPMDA